MFPAGNQFGEQRPLGWRSGANFLPSFLGRGSGADGFPHRSDKAIGISAVSLGQWRFSRLTRRPVGDPISGAGVHRRSVERILATWAIMG